MLSFKTESQRRIFLYIYTYIYNIHRNGFLYINMNIAYFIYVPIEFLVCFAIDSVGQHFSRNDFRMLNSNLSLGFKQICYHRHSSHCDITPIKWRFLQWNHLRASIECPSIYRTLLFRWNKPCGRDFCRIRGHECPPPPTRRNALTFPSIAIVLESGRILLQTPIDGTVSGIQW